MQSEALETAVIMGLCLTSFILMQDIFWSAYFNGGNVCIDVDDYHEQHIEAALILGVDILLLKYISKHIFSKN